MKTKTFGKRSGFTLPELVIVIGIICLLIAIALPYYEKIRATKHKTTCIENLHKIEKIKTDFVLWKYVPAGKTISLKDLFGTNLPVCPSGGTYTINPVDIPPTCSEWSLGHALSTDESVPPKPQ